MHLSYAAVKRFIVVLRDYLFSAHSVSRTNNNDCRILITMTEQGRAETFGGAGAQSIKGAHRTRLLIGLCFLLMCIEMDASVLIQQQIP